MGTQNGQYFYAMYDTFYIDNEDDNYRLHVLGYNGTAGNCVIISMITPLYSQHAMEICM